MSGARHRRDAARGRGGAVHRGLVGERALVGTRYLADATLRAEYDRDIAPRTGAALAKILAELYPSGARPPQRALDLGAGTGAAGGALRAYFGELLEVVAVDRVPGPGIVAAELARELPPVSGRFDLVVAAHLLNELWADHPESERLERRARLVRAWWDNLVQPGGLLILLEPALRTTSRDLLGVRDRLVAGGLRVIAPCFWAGACPALLRERDWCHDAAPLDDGRRADFSHLVFAPAASRAPASNVFRVVSDPLREKGRLRLFVCGGRSGREPLVRLDRDTTAANAALDGVARGDAIQLSGALQRAGDGLRLTPETAVISSRECLQEVSRDRDLNE